MSLKNTLVKATQETSTAIQVVLSEPEEEKMMEQIGFTNWAESNRWQRREVSLLKKHGELIKLKDIRRIGISYNMVLVKPKHYMGAPGPETAQKASAFTSKTKGAINTDNFYILAPIENVTKPRREAPVYIADPEPVLFYHVGNEMFQLIDQWGGDFTKGRLIKSWLLQHMITVGFCTTVVAAIAVWFGLVTSTKPMASFFYLVSSLVPLVVSAITFSVKYDESSQGTTVYGNIVDEKVFDQHFGRG